MNKNPVGAVLTIMVMGGFIAIVLMLAFFKVTIPPENRDFFNQGFGSLGTMAMAGFMYWVGTSLSSAKKDATIQAQAVSAIPAGTTTTTTKTDTVKTT